MVNVIRLGYIGIPTALMMVFHYAEVIGTDYNKELVDTLNARKTTFEEDGLVKFFSRGIESSCRIYNRVSSDRYIHCIRTYTI